MFQARNLPAFFTVLKTGGFMIGPIEQQRVIDLLFELEAGDRMPATSERLANMLACVVCTSAEQQIHFRRHFLACFGEWRGREPLVAPRRPAQAAMKIADIQDAARRPGLWNSLRVSQRKIIFRFSIATMLLISAFVIIPLVIINWEWLSQAELFWNLDVGRLFQPGLVGLLAEGPRSVWNAIRNTIGHFVLFLAFPFFSGIALWITAPGHASAAFLNRRLVDYRPEFTRLMVQISPYNPFLERDLHRRVQDLRRARLVPSREIDVKASLDATLDHAGFFIPIFARRPVAPEHLVLIDRRDANDHLMHYALLLVEALRAAQVYVDSYYYNSDMRRLFASVGSVALTFEEVASRHPQHRLLVIGRGDRFFDAATGNLQPWAHLIREFSHRVLLTPVPREMWGYREQTLQTELQTTVLPVSPRAIFPMVEVLVEEEPLPLKPYAPQTGPRAEAMADLAGLLDDRAVRWIESGTPDEKSLVSLDRALRTALPRETYNLLTACAVYPELIWNLTVHLGIALTRQSRSMADQLLTLCNLPWFRTGRMPNWLRARLTTGMSGDLYEQVSATLNALLLTSVGFARKTMAIEVGLSRPETISAEQRLASRMRDPILVDFMTRLRRERTAVKLPRIIARMMRSAGPVRDIFSRAQFNDLDVNGHAMREFINAEGIEAIRIGDWSKKTGPEIRAVTELLCNSGPPIATIESYFLYLPVGKNRPARLVDDMSVALYLQRRKTMMQISIINTITVVFTAALLFADQFQTMNAGLGVVTAGIWIAGPFWILHRLLVRPVLKRFALFPGFQSGLPGPRYLSNLFIREDRMGHVAFPEESVTGATSSSRPEMDVPHHELDRLGKHVEAVFLAMGGKVASLKDGTALAVTGNEVRRFDSLANYRGAVHDRTQWTELKTIESKRDFYREAAVVLQQINGDPVD